MKTFLEQREKYKQRADYTYKHNLKYGRHGWLRLTPAYSVKLVYQILENNQVQHRVFDPFSGTGTTPLCAASMGKIGHSTDINPFLVWLGNAKGRFYSKTQLDNFTIRAKEIVSGVRDGVASSCAAPPIHNIRRWWSESSLDFLCQVKAGIDSTPELQTRDLLSLAFCRTLISVSNAVFNHQSMSFKREQNGQTELPFIESPDYADRFLQDVQFVKSGASENPPGLATVTESDARKLSELKESEFEPFDIVITSPPYPNRMSYIRELRPYMYWLGFLNEAREAGELDWLAVGGTWGVATSRLAEWKPDKVTAIPGYLKPVLGKIAKGHKKNGHLMAQYVHKYFEDMAKHFDSVKAVLSENASLHYIVGNSTFYGNNVPSGQIYADMLGARGYFDVKVEIIRKRNSKKSLYEYLVSARYSK